MSKRLSNLELAKRARNMGLPPGEALVLGNLCDRGRSPWPTNEQLSRDLNLSQTQIKLYLFRLEKKKLLTRQLKRDPGNVKTWRKCPLDVRRINRQWRAWKKKKFRPKTRPTLTLRKPITKPQNASRADIGYTQKPTIMPKGSTSRPTLEAKKPDSIGQKPADQPARQPGFRPQIDNSTCTIVDNKIIRDKQAQEKRVDDNALSSAGALSSALTDDEQAEEFNEAMLEIEEQEQADTEANEETNESHPMPATEVVTPSPQPSPGPPPPAKAPNPQVPSDFFKPTSGPQPPPPALRLEWTQLPEGWYSPKRFEQQFAVKYLSKTQCLIHDLVKNTPPYPLDNQYAESLIRRKCGLSAETIIRLPRVAEGQPQ